jgi:hypothetical protein
MDGHSRKTIGNDRADSRYITDAKSSRDACELYSIRDPNHNSDATAMTWSISREDSHSKKDSTSRYGKIVGMLAKKVRMSAK